ERRGGVLQAQMLIVHPVDDVFGDPPTRVKTIVLDCSNSQIRSIVREEGQTIPLNRGLLREAPAMRFAWIAAETADFSIVDCCRVLGVSPSGFYAWQQRPASPRAGRDRQLRVQIRVVYRQPRPVRTAAYREGFARIGRARQREACRPSDARGRPS